MGTAFGTPFDRAFWNRNNPFTLVENGARPMGMKIYFDCGTEDQFGFDLGAQAFHDLAGREENSARISSLSRRT